MKEILNQSIQTLTDTEMSNIVGGLSETGKKILKYVGIGAGVIVAGAGVICIGHELYKHLKGGEKKDVPEIDYSKPISGGNSYGFIPDYSKKTQSNDSYDDYMRNRINNDEPEI